VFAAPGRSNANAGGNYIEHGDEQYVARSGTLADGRREVVVAAAAASRSASATSPASRSARPRAAGSSAAIGTADAVEGIVLCDGREPVDGARGPAREDRQLNGGIPPPGMHIDTFYDRGALVHRTLRHGDAQPDRRCAARGAGRRGVSDERGRRWWSRW
jgi:cobalt-zinc-cadmium resistance protein CzcA